MLNSTNIDALIGADVVDTEDHKIGTITQVYTDAITERPSWVSIKTGGLFGGGVSFAPLERAVWTDDVLHIGYDRDAVKKAPRVDTDGALERADEDALSRHYGLGGPDTSVPADTSGRADTSGPTVTSGPVDTSNPVGDAEGTQHPKHAEP